MSFLLLLERRQVYIIPLLPGIIPYVLSLLFLIIYPLDFPPQLIAQRSPALLFQCNILTSQPLFPYTTEETTQLQTSLFNSSCQQPYIRFS